MRRHDVAYWHFSDIAAVFVDVRFSGKSRHRADGWTLPVLTQAV
jgi:hypothetical protein